MPPHPILVLEVSLAPMEGMSRCVFVGSFLDPTSAGLEWICLDSIGVCLRQARLVSAGSRFSCVFTSMALPIYFLIIGDGCCSSVLILRSLSTATF